MSVHHYSATIVLGVFLSGLCCLFKSRSLFVKECENEEHDGKSVHIQFDQTMGL